MSKTPQVAQSAVDAIATNIPPDGVYGLYELAKIRKSPDNRKRFNEGALQELAESIKAMGVAQPILIRPVTPTAEAPEDFEIVAGERRYRASIIAGKTTIPAMSRALSDLDAAKIRILENLQREDPHEIEEAEGYQLLMLQHGYTADQLAEEVHKSKAYIYARLKLCSLTSEVREEFLDDKISASIALLIARIPTPALQVQALKEINKPLSYPYEPLSYRKAVEYVQDRFTLDLKIAVFNVADAKLLASAGACTKCPKRTGNQPELFPDMSADVCTDPDCFGEKRAAHHARTIVQANKKGIPVLEGDEAAEKLRSRWHSAGEHVTSDTDLQLFDRRAPATKSSATPGSLLAPQAMPPVALYVKHADGSTLAFYERGAMQQALENAGACETFDAHAARIQDLQASPAGKQESADQLARQQAHEATELLAKNTTTFRVALYKQLRNHAATAGLSLQSLREFTKLAVREMSLPHDLMGDAYQFDKTSDDSVCAYVDTAGLPEIQLLLIDLMVGEYLSVGYWDVTNGRVDEDNFTTVLAMARHEGIDPDQVKESMFPSPINIDTMQQRDLTAFIAKYPNRIDELAKIVMVHPRGELVGMLEVAANGLGYVYDAGGFKLKPTEPAADAPAPATTEASDAVPAAQEGDIVACDGEDLEAAIAEPAPAQKPQKAKPGAKKINAPATPAATQEPAAPRKAKPDAKKATLVPAAAWPFPKSAGEIFEQKAPPAAAAQDEAPNPTTQEEVA